MGRLWVTVFGPQKGAKDDGITMEARIGVNVKTAKRLILTGDRGIDLLELSTGEYGKDHADVLQEPLKKLTVSSNSGDVFDLPSPLDLSGGGLRLKIKFKRAGVFSASVICEE